MKRFYISHPFRGNEAENRRVARAITATCQRNFKKFHFYNPLDAMQAQAEAGLTEEEILKHCLCMLQACHGIVMAGDWETSKGCNVEYLKALTWGKEVYSGLDEFFEYMDCWQEE